MGNVVLTAQQCGALVDGIEKIKAITGLLALVPHGHAEPELQQAALQTSVDEANKLLHLMKSLL